MGTTANAQQYSLYSEERRFINLSAVKVMVCCAAVSMVVAKYSSSTPTTYTALDHNYNTQLSDPSGGCALPL